MHPPVLEPPTQQQGRPQAGLEPVQDREREVTRTEPIERERTDTTTEGNTEERPPGPREPTGAQSTPAETLGKVDRPRRETRRPAQYDDFECYALQPQEKPAEINNENYLVTTTRKKQKRQEDEERNECHLMEEEKFGKNGNPTGLFFCAQEISLAHEFAQKSSPFCKRANLSQEGSCCKDTNNCKNTLSLTEMDKENVQPPTQDSEASLEGLL